MFVLPVVERAAGTGARLLLPTGSSRWWRSFLRAACRQACQRPFHQQGALLPPVAAVFARALRRNTGLFCHVFACRQPGMAQARITTQPIRHSTKWRHMLTQQHAEPPTHETVKERKMSTRTEQQWREQGIHEVYGAEKGSMQAYSERMPVKARRIIEVRKQKEEETETVVLAWYSKTRSC